MIRISAHFSFVVLFLRNVFCPVLQFAYVCYDEYKEGNSSFISVEIFVFVYLFVTSQLLKFSTGCLKVVVISITWLISLIDIWYLSDVFEQKITVCKILRKSVFSVYSWKYHALNFMFLTKISKYQKYQISIKISWYFSSLGRCLNCRPVCYKYQWVITSYDNRLSHTILS